MRSSFRSSGAPRSIPRAVFPLVSSSLVLLIAAACSDPSAPDRDVGPNGSDGGVVGPETGPDQLGGDSGGPEGGPPGPPPEPGIGYIKSYSFGLLEALYYDPASSKSISLDAAGFPNELRRPRRGGRPFAFLRDVSSLPTVFKGVSSKTGAAKAAFTLTPKSASSPKIDVDVDAAGAAYYAGELDQRGFVDFFKDGVRLSHGAGRVVATSSGAWPGVSFLDARGGAVAWSVGIGTSAKLVLLWPGQTAEEPLEGEPGLSGFAEATSFSPSERCFAFPAKVTSPTAQVGLGIRCKGEPTRVPALAGGLPIANAGASVVWHPSLDRLAAMDFGIGGNKFACIANRTGPTWSLEHVTLPAEAKTASAIALAPDGSDLYVVAEEGTGPTRLFAVPFGGASPNPSAPRPIALGSHVAVIMAGFSAFDGRLAVIRATSGVPGLDLVLVAPDGTTKTVFTTMDRIKDVRWAPNGRSLVVRVSGGLPPEETGDVYLVDAAGGTPRKLNEPGQIVVAMKWSDTSEQVGFIAKEGEVTGRLYVANAAAGTPLGAAIDEGVTEFLTDPPRPVPR